MLDGTPGHLAHDAGEIVHIGMEEHPGRYGHRCVPYGKGPAVGQHGGGQPPPTKPELISGDVESDNAIACLAENPAVPPGPAGHVKAYLSTACAEAFPEERLFLLMEECGEGLVIPLGIAIVPSDLGHHRDRLTRPICHGQNQCGARAHPCTRYPARSLLHDNPRT